MFTITLVTCLLFASMIVSESEEFSVMERFRNKILNQIAERANIQALSNSPLPENLFNSSVYPFIMLNFGGNRPYPGWFNVNAQVRPHCLISVTLSADVCFCVGRRRTG